MSLDRTNGNCGTTQDAGIKIVAAENLMAFQVITSKGMKADSADPTTRNIIIGFALNNIMSGFTGNAIAYGEITNPAWSFSRGDKIFLNGLGTVSNVAPANSYTVLLGTAVTPNTINVNIQPSILL